MAKLFNLARMTTATTGTGTVTLGSAVSSYLTFANAGVQNGDQVTYVIEEGANREIGRGTYTSSGTTLSRDTVLNSTAGGTTKITLAGAATVFIDAAAQDFVVSPNIQTFDASGTWNKPTDQLYTMVLIEGWGGGGSGARRNTTGQAGGGGGGGYNWRVVPFALLGATETPTIGAGGASVTTGDTNGNDGSVSTFGSWLTAYAGGGGTQSSTSNTQGGGGGGATGSAVGNLPGSSGGSSGGSGGSPASSRDGGAAGGGVTSAGVGSSGGDAYGGGAGGGSTHSTGTANSWPGGTSVLGGNGGAGSSSGAAGAGVQPGGGGGGARNGNSSGAGGAGRVIVTCW